MKIKSGFEENYGIINNYSKKIDDFKQECGLVIEMTLKRQYEKNFFTSSSGIEVNLFFFSTVYKFINLVEYFERISSAVCEKCFKGDYSQMMEDILNSDVLVDLNEIFSERNSFLCMSSTVGIVNPDAYLRSINKRAHEMSKVIKWYSEKISL